MKTWWKFLLTLLAAILVASACIPNSRVTLTPRWTQPIAVSSTASIITPNLAEELSNFVSATQMNAPIHTTPIHTKIPATETPAPTKTPTVASATAPPPAAVMQELGFFPGAGGADCPQDLLFDPNTHYPNASALHYSLFIASDESRVICLYGVPVGEEFNIELIGPDGSSLVSGNFIIRLASNLEVYWLDSPAGPTLVGDGFPQEGLQDTVGIDISWPLAMQDQGTIRVSSDTFSIETGFTNPQSSQTAWLSIPSKPAGKTSLFVKQGCFEFSYGEQVQFIGGGLPPGSEVPIGIYHNPPGQGVIGELASSGMLTADEGGLINGYVSIEDTDPEGLYYIVAILNPAATHAVWDNAGPIACFQVR